ncbi:hypothetical protein U1Q18_033690 [Sarracenia purpurea var. burkii]
MDDFGMLARDFGLRPHGKSAPMAPSKSTIGVGSDGLDSRDRSSSSSSFRGDDHGREFLFNDVFGGPPKYASGNNSKSTTSLSDYDYDSIFKSSSTPANDTKNRASSPVYDKPVYDEDIFDGLPGLKSKSTSSKVRHDNDVLESISSLPIPNHSQSAAFDDLLGNFGRNEKSEPKNNKSSSGLDDLIPGFGASSPPRSSRPLSESGQPQRTSFNSTKPTPDMMGDPFVVLESTPAPVASSTGLFTDPLEEISRLGNSGNSKVRSSSVSGGIFDDIDPLNGFGKSVPAFSSEINNRVKERSPSKTGSSMGKAQTSASTESFGRPPFRDSENHSQKISADNYQETHQTMFDMPSVSTDSRRSDGQTASPSHTNANSSETNYEVDDFPGSEEHGDPCDDAWLTVSEIPIFTQPTSAPPPSRPPPPIPSRASKSGAGFSTSNARKKGNEFSSSPHPPVKSAVVSQIDELEDFAMGRSRNSFDEYVDIHSGEEVNTNSSAAASAAAMKEAMDRAEAKFRHAKEVREREYAKTARSKEAEAVQLEKDEDAMQDGQEREYRENQELHHERRKREEEERERKRFEKEMERAREIEREREKARQAVERATREARERAAAEARLKAERAAVSRAQAEARERAERAAVQRAQAEARDRAAAEARERAEKAAAEAREKTNAEAREKAAAAARAEAEARRRAERAAVERAAAEARDRAAAEARERASAAARMNQEKNDNDLESFFSMGSRPSSAPRPRSNSSDPGWDPQFQSKERPEVQRTSVGTSSNIRKASSTTNIVDDLTSIFGAAPSSGEFQDVEGETEERRRARLERHQRTQERAARALAEKNQRDLQTQRDQEERHVSYAIFFLLYYYLK